MIGTREGWKAKSESAKKKVNEAKLLNLPPSPSDLRRKAPTRSFRWLMVVPSRALRLRELGFPPRRKRSRRLSSLLLLLLLYRD